MRFSRAAVWAVSVRRLSAGEPRPWRAAARDALGCVAGGLAVGLAGIAYLVATGTWQHLVEIFEKWNGAYTRLMFDLLGHRLMVELFYFPPLNLFLPIGVGVAIWNLWPKTMSDQVFTRRVLAALFLAWVAQAAFVQRQFHYVHVPEMLLLLAVAAANRWAAVVPLVLVCSVIAGEAWLIADRHRPLDIWLKKNVPEWGDQYILVPRHPLFMPKRMACWPDCFRMDLSERERASRMNAVALYAGSFASVDPVEIGEVVAKLRELGAGEGEVLCWHDSPHAVYVDWPGRPPLRFMHLSTTMIGLEQYERMKRELIRLLARDGPRVRFVVSDLERVYADAPDSLRRKRRETGPDQLPPTVTAEQRAAFPLDRPIVWRSGNGRGRVSRFTQWMARSRSARLTIASCRDGRRSNQVNKSTTGTRKAGKCGSAVRVCVSLTNSGG